jgi:cell division protein FtsZ
VSITGGKDLTLYEVDEAATRIREEVDSDANIIVGATFDESLEGIIRVSVVATGIDKVATQGAAPADVRIAELTQRLRSDSQKVTDRIERSDMSVTGRGLGAPLGQATTQGAMTDSIESAAKAAVAAALLPQSSVEEVTIRPIPPKPSLFLDPARNEPMQQEAPAKAFIPPQPERVAVRQQRMPRIDELPIPAQNQLRAKRSGGNDADHPEKRRMTLLQRLASVGLGRKEEHTEEAADYSSPPRPSAPPAFDRPPARPLHRPNEARPPDPVSEYAKRAPQGLDPMGRQTPVHNSTEEDQLDIPAFLRRQAN